jgi:hypothetical protein
MAGQSLNNRNETKSRCWSESRELPILASRSTATS